MFRGFMQFLFVREMYHIGRGSNNNSSGNILAPFLGLGSVVGFYFLWPYIKPFFIFLGFDKLLTKFGLLSDTASTTIYNIIIALFALYVCAIVLFLIVGVLTHIIGNFAETKVGAIVLQALAFIIIFPLSLPFLIPMMIYYKLTGKGLTADQKRKKKNANQFRFMKYVNTQDFHYPDSIQEMEKDGTEPAGNVISKNEALDILNVLPTSLNNFIISGTYDRELFLLFPCPNVTRELNGDSDYVYGVKLNLIMKEKDERGLPIRTDIFNLDFIGVGFEYKDSDIFKAETDKIYLNDIEYFFDVNYNENRHWIKEHWIKAALYKFNNPVFSEHEHRKNYWNSYMEHVHGSFNRHYAELEYRMNNTNKYEKKVEFELQFNKYRVKNIEIAEFGIRSARGKINQNTVVNN